MDNQERPANVAWGCTEPVREMVNRWRVHDDWWRVPISPTYHTVRTPTALLEANRDDLVGDRYPQRVIDWRRTTGLTEGVGTMERGVVARRASRSG